MDMMNLELLSMKKRIDPWIDPNTRFTTLSLKPNSPQEIVDLFDKWKQLARKEAELNGRNRLVITARSWVPFSAKSTGVPPGTPVFL